jgi:hypothetical protein
MQHERGGQTADSAADNNDFHRNSQTDAQRIMVRKVHWAQRFSRVVVDGGAAGPARTAYLSDAARQIGANRIRDCADKGGIRVSGSALSRG